LSWQSGKQQVIVEAQKEIIEDLRKRLLKLEEKLK